MKHRIVCLICDFLSLASIAGVFILNHFGTTRMGMIRWLNSYNKGIESSMPTDFLKIDVVLLLAILLAVCFVTAIKTRGSLRAINYVGLIASSLSFITLLYVVLGTSTSTLKIHYFATLLFAMSTLFLSISCFINLKFINKSNS